MKIVLIGYMGSGKSTIGRALSERIGCEFTDLDDYIEDKVGMTPLQIFAEKGDIYFRKIESRYLVEALSRENQFVLALGGGTPCYGSNMKQVLEHTDRVFYLSLPVMPLVGRLTNEKKNRPLISNIENEELPEFIGKHLLERNAFYQKANHIIHCEGKTVDEIVTEIQGLV